jgi:hypothetical protein
MDCSGLSSRANADTASHATEIGVVGEGKSVSTFAENCELQVKKLKWKSAARLGCLLFFSYFMNAVSFRMLARTSYAGVAASDALLAWYAFTMVKRIGDADTLLEKFGYTVGGILGSLSGMWLDAFFVRHWSK